MPRRGSASMSRGPAIPRRPMSTAPIHRPPPPPAPAPRQPGLFAQMATTAAGVAVGSAVGHTIGEAMTGSRAGGGVQENPAYPPVPEQIPPMQPQQQAYNPCQRELEQFLDCAQGHSDISLCGGFSEAVRQCKLRYGLLMPKTGDSDGRV